MTRQHSRSRGVAGAIAIALCACAATARADKICFQTLNGLPELVNNTVTMTGPPQIDGDITDADKGYSGAFRFQFQNGTPVSNGSLQVGRDGSGNLYFALGVNNATGFSVFDRAVIAFKDSTGRYGRFDIQPNCDGTGVAKNCDANGPTCDATQPACSTNTRPLIAQFATGTASGTTITWNSPAPLPAPDNGGNAINYAARSTGTGSGTNNAWSIELRIPATSALGWTFNNTPFQIFGDTFHVDAAASPPTVTELVWPETAPNLVFNNVYASQDSANWGAATLGGTCAGVHVKRIYTDGTLNNGATPAPWVINFDRTDMHLSADFENTRDVAANGVTPTFQVADFGASTRWKTVNAAGNGSTAFNIGAMSGTTPGTASVTVGPWNVVADPDNAAYQATPDQCIRVVLSSNSGVTFDQESTYQNMMVGHSSVFDPNPAQIRGDIAEVPQGKDKNKYEMLITGHPEVTEAGTRLTMLVHGTRHTGNFIDLPSGRIVHDKPEYVRFEVALPIPSFGYYIDHPLSAQEHADEEKKPPAERLKAWKFDITGVNPRVVSPDNELVKRSKIKLIKRADGVTIAPGLYTIEVARNDVVKVSPRSEYIGPPCTCCGGGCSSMPPGSTTPIALGFAVIGLLAYRPLRRRRW